MDHTTPKARAASQRTKIKTLKAVEWEENQPHLTSIEYEADRLMAQQMLAEQPWKSVNKSHIGGNKCATQQSDGKDGGGEKSDERGGGEISRSARDLCALRELKNDGSDEKEEDDEEEENIASHSSLCPAGIWLTEEDAMERHGISAKVMRLYKKECTPENMYFAHGNSCGAPVPYNKQFVFISPENTAATRCPVSLPNWSRMCEYLSNNNFDTEDDVDERFRLHFVKYTTKKATPANIADAFAEGVLKHSSQLQNIAPKRRGRPSDGNTNNNNSNKKQKKKREETVDDLLPSEERLTTIAVNRLKQLDPKDIASDKDLSKIGSLMKIVGIDNLKYKADRQNSDKKREVNMLFSVCPSCGHNRIYEARKNQSPLCRTCGKKKAVDKRTVQRRKDNAELRVAANSTVPIATLTPEEVVIRMRNMNRERQRKEKQRKRLEEKLTESQVERDSKKLRSENEGTESQVDPPPRRSSAAGHASVTSSGSAAGSHNAHRIIRITLQRPMGIVFAPNSELGYGARIIDLQGAAAATKQLCVGDTLFSVNKINCAMSKSKEVLTLIGQTEGDVDLAFLRSTSTAPTSAAAAAPSAATY